MRVITSACVALALWLPALAWSAQASAAQPDANDARRFRLTASVVEPAAQESGRYRLRSRFAAQESAGELRESGSFSLIGRFAKGGVSCDFSAIFADGFEGN